ncbi:MAG: FAD-dependent oxidoreductase [Lachnospiraceae bacterium]|nr:FAD-dependent oxidoreductase [Lachnospiraceae bacterium]
MGTWNEFLQKEGTPPEWPYPVKFGEETEYDVDVVVLGGGIAGCWAAITAARNGAKVAIMDKGDIRRSGSGGPGCDHWCNVPANPHSRVNPDEWANDEMNTLGDFSNGIGIEIQCREDFDTLLEMEQMGGKIRDTDDDFLGVEGRYDDTKFMFSPRYSVDGRLAPAEGWGVPGYNPPDQRKNTVIRVWGTTFKPALKKECQKLGVIILDRTMATSVLNEGGKQGGRVVGATGINVRTGEFVIVKAPTVIISAAGLGFLYTLDTEHGGISTMHSRNECGDATVMAWKAGAKITMMEGSSPSRFSGGLKHKWYTGGADASYENIPLVDADNNVLPAPKQSWEDGGVMFSPNAKVIADLREGIKAGKYKLPFFADFAGTKPEEAHATWDLMLTEESTTKVMVDTMEQDGFDKHKDQILNYTFIEMQPSQQYRDAGSGGGIMTDWDLMSNVEGLYAAGGSMFSPQDHSYCAATGRYAGRKAAAFAKKTTPGEICRAQVDAEKARCLAPTKNETGIDWKEMNFGINRVMQYFASEFKNETLLNMGLEEIDRIEKNAVPQLSATDPHKLMRTLEDLFILDSAKIVMNAMKERRLTSPKLRIERTDYPNNDPEEEKHYLAQYLKDGELHFERIPTRYWGDLKEGYEAHNQDYTGVYDYGKEE